MNFKKMALAAAAAATLGLSTGASAAPFTIDATPYGGSMFEAGMIVANYQEMVTFTSPTQVAFSLVFTPGQFIKPDMVNPVNGTGLGSAYNLYGVFMGTGTYDPVANTISLTPFADSYKLYIDPAQNTLFTVPANGLLPFGISGNGDDVELLNGVVQYGTASLVTPCVLTNCGSVGQQGSVGLTAAGEAFFVAPDPFYTLTIQTAQLTTPIQTGLGANTQIGGSFNITFIPEPGSLALAGLALVGMAGALRKRS